MNFKIEIKPTWFVMYFLMLFYFIQNNCVAQNTPTNQKVNGKREGLWIKKRWNGRIKYKGYYLKGEKTGYWKIYLKNGIHHLEGELEKGKKIGNWYLVHTQSTTKLDMTIWDGQGNCVGGATLAW